MPLLMPGGANYIGVRNVAGTVSWYTEKLGLRKVPIELDDGEDCVALGFATDEAAFVLGPTGKSSGELTPLLYSSNVNKAREWLKSRGVNVGDVQRDPQGTQYFQMRDLEREHRRDPRRTLRDSRNTPKTVLRIGWRPSREH